MELLTALGGAIVGGLLAYLGQWYLTTRKEKILHRGAARAVLSEAKSNLELLNVVLSGRAPHRLRTHAWDALQSTLATRMTPADFDETARAFVVAGLYEDALAGFAQGGASARERLMEAAGNESHRLQSSCAILERYAYTKDESLAVANTPHTGLEASQTARRAADYEAGVEPLLKESP